MNWEALGAIAEMIGVVAVLITLIYLAIQVRQGTAVSREAILRNQTDRNMDNSKFIAGTPGLMELYIRAMDDPDQVTREERWRFGSYMYGMFLDFQEAYHFNKSRRQKDYWWPMIRKNVAFYLSRPGGRAWWKSQGRNMLDAEFVAFVDKEILQG
ncbi:hypothetical protein EYC98_06745 [Halieaceae bacterium IMCC14734]|uniref:DUF4760 domain-containing protein n=1 Tax=Candidatus Litorirhabdus singularis TaxID=2518993 RepID=A0ABT3TE50_9GAMM|nr:hypothetical protein [Candidatus Litorirhabdus singularis]MCX2980571.1 hypothetical protein [Candidatus Litorirhabdus singularis]